MSRIAVALCLFSLLVVSLCPVQPVGAEPEIIRVPSDYPTIKQAVNASNPGDTIIVSEGTYVEGEIWITKSNLTLIANGTVVVDGLGEARWVFYVIADSTVIKGFTVINSKSGYQFAGICLDHAQDCRIENNTAKNNAYGIFLWISSNNTVVGNNASLNDAGIVLDISAYNTITNNTAKNNGRGIDLGSSYWNILIGNNASNNGHVGIEVAGCVGNTLVGNKAADNGLRGISLIDSVGSILRNNNMTGNPRNFNLPPGDELPIFIHDIDTSNLVDGKQLVYLVNQHNLTVDTTTFPEVGYVGVVNSTGITVKQTAVSNNSQGVLFVHVTNSIIENVTVRNCDTGIQVSKSSGTIVLESTATKCWEGIGVRISNATTLNRNVLTRNGYGIYLNTADCNVTYNVAVNNTYGGIFVGGDNHVLLGNIVANTTKDEIFTGGIVLDGADKSFIVNNTITTNPIGIFVFHCGGNIFSHNNFIENKHHVFLGLITPNEWDNGYPSGGNYWSDYNGTDLCRGSFQNITGSDGIGDTPYIVDENEQDRYPLMKPYGGLHDIGIVASVSEKTIIAEGYYTTVTMNVTVINYGTQMEAFNFTSQIDTTVQNQTLTLASRNSTTFTFTFNTTGLSKGVYTFSAYATPVPDETCTTDNNYTTQIIITIPGDVDADFDVDLYDAVKLLVRYGAKKGNPSYDANCDIDGDGDIDLSDAVILLTHYGQKDP